MKRQYKAYSNKFLIKKFSLFNTDLLDDLLQIVYDGLVQQDCIILCEDRIVLRSWDTPEEIRWEEM